MLTVLTVLGLSYVLLFTPTLGVRAIEVSGIDRVDEEIVLDLAGIERDQPILRVDVSGAERRIAELPQVEHVVVSRSLAATVTIEISERRPIAYFAAHDGIRLVDASGVPFHRVAKAPKKLPELTVREVSATDPATAAAATVLTGIPQELRRKVRAVAADTPGNVELTLAGGKTVRWGNTQQMERKSQVLAALLSQPGEVYDVSSPELPTVR